MSQPRAHRLLTYILLLIFTLQAISTRRNFDRNTDVRRPAKSRPKDGPADSETFRRQRRPRVAEAGSMGGGPAAAVKIVPLSSSSSSTLNTVFDEHLVPRTKVGFKPQVSTEDFLEDPRNEPKSEATNSDEGQVTDSGGEAAADIDSSLDLEEEHRSKRNNKGVHHHGHQKFHGHLRGKNFELENGVKLVSRGEVDGSGYDEFDSNGIVVKRSSNPQVSPGAISANPPPPGTKTKTVFTSSAFENAATGATTTTSLTARIPQVSPATVAVPQVAPATVAVSHVAPATTAVPQVAPATTAVPQVAPATVAVPQVAPATVAVPQVVPATTAVPQVAPATVAVSHVAPATTAVPQVAPATTAVPQVAPATVAVSHVAPATVAVSHVAPATTAVPQVAPATVAFPQVAPATVAVSHVAPATVAVPQVVPATVAVPQVVQTSSIGPLQVASSVSIPSQVVLLAESITHAQAQQRAAAAKMAHAPPIYLSGPGSQLAAAAEPVQSNTASTPIVPVASMPVPISLVV